MREKKMNFTLPTSVCMSVGKGVPCYLREKNEHHSSSKCLYKGKEKSEKYI